MNYFHLDIFHTLNFSFNLLLFFSGQLYGLEKFWAFLKYYKHSSKLTVDNKLKEYLSKFNTIDDFRVLEVSFML